MLVTNHVLAGALIGSVLPGPVPAFAAGMVSHFALDRVPHWGDQDHRVFLRVAVVDGLVGASALLALWRTTPPGRRTTVLAGMLGGAFPDADKPWDLFLGGSPFPAWFDRFHQSVQRESTRRMPQEVALAALGLLAARRALTR